MAYSPLAISPMPQVPEADPTPTFSSEPKPYRSHLDIVSASFPGPSMKALSADERPKAGSMPLEITEGLKSVSLSLSDEQLRNQEEMGPGESEAKQDEDGIWRKDTALTVEERNAKLEQMGEEEEINEDKKFLDKGWGRPFAVQWINATRLPFHRTRHLRNPFNSSREVKISRDGTEVEPSVGEALLREFDRVLAQQNPVFGGPGSSPSPPRDGNPTSHFHGLDPSGLTGPAST